ncbi:UDP-N-acetylglucosamine 4,6-dehydratase [Amylibacter sp.]|nr:UDP-N-acetylglucosamine 4,6-dehydratase [Amylibacter sp.]MDB9785474.1 UDP-N-acetylglucosamine 4,6-dehydratase [Amylibacter sp.]
MNTEINQMQIIGRKKPLFDADIFALRNEIEDGVTSKSFLVIGGAGTIGQAVTKEILSRKPAKLHVVDISENNLVELVRDIRSSIVSPECDFATFALDVGSLEFDAFWQADGKYDYVLNLSALKHVRNEKDPFTLMRMVQVNIVNTVKTIEMSINKGVGKYFCVSTDKATNPVSMMGASKSIMEMFLARYKTEIEISTARFANVAFSDGSLLDGFDSRIKKKQPIVAPNDIKRFFVTPKESGQLCLLSCLFGKDGDIFFPKLNNEFGLITFSDIARRYLSEKNYTPQECIDENEARKLAKEEIFSKDIWPCLFTKTDTTGEKPFEEFYTNTDQIDWDKFLTMGIVKHHKDVNEKKLLHFMETIDNFLKSGTWSREDIIELFNLMLPNFNHLETGKFLDAKM